MFEPWFSQIVQFFEKNGVYDFPGKKVKLAIALAEECETIPETYTLLAAELTRIRDKYPVTSPNDVGCLGFMVLPAEQAYQKIPADSARRAAAEFGVMQLHHNRSCISLNMRIGFLYQCSFEFYSP